jgi:hypothetical protein
MLGALDRHYERDDGVDLRVAGEFVESPASAGRAGDSMRDVPIVINTATVASPALDIDACSRFETVHRRHAR